MNCKLLSFSYATKIIASIVFLIGVPVAHAADLGTLDFIQTVETSAKPVSDNPGHDLVVPVMTFSASNNASPETVNRAGGVLVEGSYIVMNDRPYLTHIRITKTLGNNEGFTAGLEHFKGFGSYGTGTNYTMIIMTESGVLTLRPFAGKKGTAHWWSRLDYYPAGQSERLQALEQKVVQMPLGEAMELAGGVYSTVDGVREQINKPSFNHGFMRSGDFLTIVDINLQSCNRLFSRHRISSKK